MSARHFDKIRLLTNQDGKKVWKTFEGYWLVGMGDEDGTAKLGIPAEDEQRGLDEWFVIQAKSGKLVVYQKPGFEEDLSTIRVYDSFDAMRPFLPEGVFNNAAEKAGLRQPEQYPEEPLEV